MPDTLEAVVAAAAFIMPGFVSLFAIWLFLPLRRVEATHFVLQCLALSGINYAVLSPFVYLAIKEEWWNTNAFAFICTTIGVLLICPFLLGYGFSKLRKAQSNSTFLGMGMLHPMAQAWDYLFSKREALCLVVSLRDGTQIAGYFGQDSLASSDERAHDLYLELHYPIGESGLEAASPHSKGVWIAADEIRYIECFSLGEDNARTTPNAPQATPGGVPTNREGLQADSGSQAPAQATPGQARGETTA